MQPITFPLDSKKAEHPATNEPTDDKTAKTHTGKGTIKSGEFQEIKFQDGGTLDHDNGNAFVKGLAKGYCGAGTVLFASAASNTPQSVRLTFDDDDVNKGRSVFTLDVVS